MLLGFVYGILTHISPVYDYHRCPVVFIAKMILGEQNSENKVAYFIQIDNCLLFSSLKKKQLIG